VDDDIGAGDDSGIGAILFGPIVTVCVPCVGGIVAVLTGLVLDTGIFVGGSKVTSIGLDDICDIVGCRIGGSGTFEGLIVIMVFGIFTGVVRGRFVALVGFESAGTAVVVGRVNCVGILVKIDGKGIVAGGRTGL
jgi:hypothetical protein